MHIIPFMQTRPCTAVICSVEPRPRRAQLCRPVRGAASQAGGSDEGFDIMSHERSCTVLRSP